MVQPARSSGRIRYTLSVSVFAAACRDGEVLLLRRARTGWMDGHLSLPAGSHDGAETLTQAAARELREEAELHVEHKHLRLIHLLHVQAGDNGRDWLGAFFLAETWHGQPALGEPDKHDLLGWHPLESLPESLVPYVRQGLQLGLQGIPFSTFGWPG